MKIGDGLAPIPKLVKAGIPVALGTDGAMWNNSNDIFREMKCMSIIHNLKAGVRAFSAEDILDMATVNGAKLFDMEKELGTLEEGKIADLILVDAAAPHMNPLRIGKNSNVSSAIVYCASGSDVSDVIIGGREIVRNRKLLTVDIQDCRAGCSRLRKGYSVDTERECDNLKRGGTFMKKKFIGIILSACMIFSLAGCAGGNSEEGDGAENSDGLRVVLIGNQRFGDNGPMDDMASGGERAAEDFGVEFRKIESEAASFEEDIRAMSEEGYDLILTTFNYMSDATALVAAEFPDTKYAAIFQELNAEGEEPIENLWSAVFRGQTTFYVDGYMAGLATKTNRVGFIVGGEEPGPNAEANGFMRGVRDANRMLKLIFPMRVTKTVQW